MKLAPNAKDILYSTPITGAVPGKIAVDHFGAGYLTGAVTSAQFKPTPGAYSAPSAKNTFAAKLDPAGAVQYAARLDLFAALGIAPDSAGRAWIVGSSCNNPQCAGNGLAIRKLDESGSHLLFGRSIGGSGSGGFRPTYSDEASGVAVDGNDAIWIAGIDRTNSIPTTPDAILSARPNYVPVPYALKLSSMGEVLHGTYISIRP